MAEFDCIWKDLNGYKFRYRISDEGVVQKQEANGSWRTLKPHMNGGKRVTVKLHREDDTFAYLPLARLVAENFIGAIPTGMAVIHRNGMKWDCADTNLLIVPHRVSGKMSTPSHRRPVVKLDRQGRIVAIYGSGTEAARKNHISKSSVHARCKGQIKDPFSLDGFNYQYERQGEKRGRKPMRISEGVRPQT